MSDLDKQIAGDWYEIRSTLDDPDTLIDHLEISPEEFTGGAKQLRFSVDQGIIEYKGSLIHTMMAPLKSLKWDSKAITSLEREVRLAAMAVLTPAVQRLFAMKKLRLYSVRGEEIEEEPKAAEGDKENVPDVKTIVAEVQEMVRQKPDLRTNSEVKRIMAQLKYYNTELEKMRSLEPNIPPEKKEGFRKNFQATFREIVEKIRGAYQTLIDEEFKENRPAENQPLLKRYDFSSLDNLFREQVRNAARIYSTIEFARKERFQMREILIELAAGEPYYIGLFSRELEMYKKLAPFGDDNVKISKAFGEQAGRYFDRYAEWVRPMKG